MKRELEDERQRLVEANIQTEDNRKKKEAVLRSIEENQAELEATKVGANGKSKKRRRKKNKENKIKETYREQSPGHI